MTTIDLTPLTDAELTHRIGAAVLDRSPELPILESERQRRFTATAHTRLADAERDRRAQAAAEAEREQLLDTLTKQRDNYRARFVAALYQLDTTPPGVVGSLLESAYALGRSAYTLGHDLAGVTGDRRMAGRYDVSDQIELHAGAAGTAFVANLRGHAPKIPTPWAAAVARLRELMPHAERIGNGG